MALTTNNLQSWKPQIDVYIDDEKDVLIDTPIDKIFTIKETDRLQITEVGFSGYAPMQEVGDLGDAIEDQAFETYQFQYQRKTYRKQAVFSSDVLQTDQIGVVEDISRNMVREVKYTKAANAYSVLRKAFNVGIVYGDSKPVISTAHPKKDGSGVQNNTYADGLQREFNYDNLKFLEDQLYAQTSNNSNVLHIGSADRNKVLIVPYVLREIAFQVAGVNGPDGKPTSTDNDKNYFRKGTKYDVFVCQFLGYEIARQFGEVGAITKNSVNNYWDTMWFLGDVEVMKKYYKFYQGKGYEKYLDDTRIVNESLIKIASDKYAYGISGWFGIVGSQGNNTIYAG